MAAAPVKLQTAGVQGVRRQYQPGALVGSKAALHEGEIEVGVAAVKFIAHDGMAEVLQVNPELMLAAGAGQQAQKRKGEMGDGRWQLGDGRWQLGDRGSRKVAEEEVES